VIRRLHNRDDLVVSPRKQNTSGTPRGIFLPSDKGRLRSKTTRFGCTIPPYLTFQPKYTLTCKTPAFLICPQCQVGLPSSEKKNYAAEHGIDSLDRNSVCFAERKSARSHSTEEKKARNSVPNFVKEKSSNFVKEKNTRNLSKNLRGVKEWKTRRWSLDFLYISILNSDYKAAHI
jgi:hypothetical protein